LPLDLESRETIRSFSSAAGMAPSAGGGWRRLSALVKGETCKGTQVSVKAKITCLLKFAPETIL